MLFALDIETRCAVPSCVGGCKHALSTRGGSAITCIGVWSPAESRVFRKMADLRKWLRIKKKLRLVTHAGKFDLNKLRYEGHDLVERWHGDTAYAANLSHSRVPDTYRALYERKRRAANEKLKKGFTHRAAKGNSLKILAPYFLGVAPFWENPENHDDAEYVLKDCEYTWRLDEFYQRRLREEGLLEHYYERTMADARMLLDAEYFGLGINLTNLARYKAITSQKRDDSDSQLRRLWAPALAARQEEDISRLELTYKEMADAQISKKPDGDHKKISTRYAGLFKAAREKVVAAPLNLDSPKQLMWLLRDYLMRDVTDFEGRQGTHRAVLNKLAKQHEDVRLLCDYRDHQKTLQLIEQYQQLQTGGRIYTTFHLENVRTGRTSSSNPNMQQVPSELHQFFEAAPGMVLLDYDMRAIEAKLIAYFSEDPVLFEVVKPGIDFHGFNVAEIYFPELKTKPELVKEKYPEERDFVKNLGYALFYGAGVNRVHQMSYISGFNWSKKRAQSAVERFRDTYQGVLDYKRGVDAAAEAGEAVPALFGRSHHYADPEDVYMKAFNTQVQFSASELLLRAGCRVKEWFDLAGCDGGVRLVVHDELVVECPKKHKEQCRKTIEKAMTDYVLDTRHGRVVLEVEGKISKQWGK